MSESKRLVRRYYLYRLTTSYGFYVPVGILYLTEYHGFGLAVVGATQAAFLLAQMLAEVPMGYVADRIGRRASLAVGNLVSAASLAVYPFLETPFGYVVVNVVWAVGWTFHSGIGEAYLYELLSSVSDESEYARISGRANTALLVTSAATAAMAGVLVATNWALPFLANATLAAVGVPILLSLPAVHGGSDDALTVRDAVGILRVQVRRPEIRWLVAYAALFYALSEVTRSFEQPIAVEVGVPVASMGLLYAAFKLVSAGAAATAGWFEDRLGARGAFVSLVPLVAFVCGAVAFVPAFALPALVLNRGVRTVVRPIRNQYLNDRLENVGRATVLSGVSMVLALAAGIANLVAGSLAPAVGPIRFFVGAGVVVAAVGGGLWVLVSPVRERGAAASSPPAGAVDGSADPGAGD